MVNFFLKETIVISCVDCFRFYVKLPIEPIVSMLNDVKCRFVQSDMFVFDDNFDSDIFIGNYQFVDENNFYLREAREVLFKDEKIDFIKRPLHKSCFVSLQKKCYQFFFAQTVKKLMIFLIKSCMFYFELTMNDFMTIKRKKDLFWYNIDETIKIAKLRVCNSFNSILKLKKKYEHTDEETIKEIFFDELPMTVDIGVDAFFPFW